MTAAITARSSTDLLSLVPYLLGFHIDSGAVAMVCSGRTVEVTIRFDDWMFDAPRMVQARIAEMVGRYDEPRVFLAAYATHRDRADLALGIMETAVAPEMVIDSVRTDGVRWWSRLCHDVCCPPEGTLCDPTSPAVASAVLAGSSALASRQELERMVEGPSLVAQGESLGELVDAQQRFQRYSPTCRLERMRTLVTELLGGRPTDAQAMELALLAGHVGARDAAWLEMEMATAREHVDLWRQVVAVSPDRHAVAPLCLMAAAAWLDGNGALMGCCLARAESLDPDYSMLDLLHQIHLEAAPPGLWNKMVHAG